MSQCSEQVFLRRSPFKLNGHMTSIISITGPRAFSLDEARALIPTLQRMTSRAQAEMNWPRRLAPEELDVVVAKWQRKVSRLGVICRNFGAVEFETSHGFWSWHHPEDDILFWRPAHSTLGERKRIKTVIIPTVWAGD